MTTDEGIAILNMVEAQGVTDEFSKAIDGAVKAMKKQIPKKPDFEGDGYADGELVYDIWICPNCNTAYEVDIDRYNYCPNCGQCIDWSEGSEQK